MTIFEINDYLLEQGFIHCEPLCKFTVKDTRLFFKYQEADFCSLAHGYFNLYMINPTTGYNSKYYTSFYSIPRYDIKQIKYEDLTIAMLSDFCTDFIKSYNDTIEYIKQQKELNKLDKLNEDF